MPGQPTAQPAGRAAQHAACSGPIQLLGRIGLVGYGVVNLLIAYLAIQAAIGEGGEPGKSGALQTLAEQPADRTLLWVVAVGLAGGVLRCERGRGLGETGGVMITPRVVPPQAAV